jgi:hypothetical protein
MSWDPDTDTLPASVHDAVSGVAITIALAAPLLVAARFVFQLF